MFIDIKINTRSHLNASARVIPAAFSRGSASPSHPRRRQSCQTLHPTGPLRGLKCTDAAEIAAEAKASSLGATEAKGLVVRRRSLRACRMTDKLSRRFLRYEDGMNLVYDKIPGTPSMHTSVCMLQIAAHRKKSESKPSLLLLICW